MQLTSILSAALLPLLALAQDTTSGTTTATLTSTVTRTLTLSRSTVTMTTSMNATGSAHHATTATARATSNASPTGLSSAPTAVPGVNELGNGAASLVSAHVAIAGIAGMLVVALM